MVAEKFFKLKGKTLVIIDWANVYGWSEKLGWQIHPQKLYKYLKSYKEIKDIRFYFGVEKGNDKSEDFQKKIKKIGYTLISKELKWVPVSLDRAYFKKFLEELAKISGNLKKLNSDIASQLEKAMKTPIYRRKCDFDCEITIDIMEKLHSIDGLILFSGDGDYKAIAEYLLNHHKQIIVVHPFGLRGKEFNELLNRKANKPFFCNVEQLREFLK